MDDFIKNAIRIEDKNQSGSLDFADNTEQKLQSLCRPSVAETCVINIGSKIIESPKCFVRIPAQKDLTIYSNSKREE